MLLDLISYFNSALLGAMLFFIIVVSPIIFSSLSSEQASKFLRVIFPRVFLFGFIISLFTVFGYYILTLYTEMLFAITSSILFFLNRNLLTPLINHHRDKGNGGEVISIKYFKALHLLSVIFFVINIIILIFLLLNITYKIF